MKEWIEELKKDKVNLMCDKYGSAVLKLIAEIERVEKELAALKALHVTKRAVAMAKVCAAAKEIVEADLVTFVPYEGSYTALSKPTKEELLEKLQQALKELDEVEKG